MNGPLDDDLAADFTDAEREALALWPARRPPEGFAARVVAAAQARGRLESGRAPVRMLAVAAVAMLVVGTLAMLRGRDHAEGAPTYDSAGLGAQDAGFREEVAPPLDGQEARPS